NKLRPRHPLQDDLPLTTSQELVEGGPGMTFLFLIPLADMGTNGAVPGKEQPNLQIRYDTALVDLSQVDRWCYVTSIELLLNSVTDNLMIY
ncbi:hypothetical protein AX16_010022, partial [Volvariella volvacea WC 439]